MKITKTVRAARQVKCSYDVVLKDGEMNVAGSNQHIPFSRRSIIKSATSLDEARQLICDYVNEAEIVPSQFTGGLVLENNTPVYMISYSGKVCPFEEYIDKWGTGIVDKSKVLESIGYSVDNSIVGTTDVESAETYAWIKHYDSELQSYYWELNAPNGRAIVDSYDHDGDWGYYLRAWDNDGNELANKPFPGDNSKDTRGEALKEGAAALGVGYVAGCDSVEASDDWYVVDVDLDKKDADWRDKEEKKRLARELADEADAYDLEHDEGIYSCDNVTASSTRQRISDLEDKIAYIKEEISRGILTEDELIDAQMNLHELEEQLNFAWQDDEAEWNYALEQQEFNPDGSLRGYSDYEDTYASTDITAAKMVPNKKIQEGMIWNRDWHRFMVQSVSPDGKTCIISEDWISEDSGEEIHKEYKYNISEDESSEYVWQDEYKEYAKPGQDDYSYWARMYATGADNYPWQEQLALDEAAEEQNEDDESIPGMHYILYNVYNGETVGSWDTAEEAKDARDDYGWSSSEWHVVETDWEAH